MLVSAKEGKSTSEKRYREHWWHLTGLVGTSLQQTFEYSPRPLQCESALWGSGGSAHRQGKQMCRGPGTLMIPECWRDGKEVWWPWKHTTWIFCFGDSSWLQPQLSFLLDPPSCSHRGLSSHELISANDDHSEGNRSSPVLGDGGTLITTLRTSVAFEGSPLVWSALS